MQVTYVPNQKFLKTSEKKSYYRYQNHLQSEFDFEKPDRMDNPHFLPLPTLSHAWWGTTTSRWLVT